MRGQSEAAAAREKDTARAKHEEALEDAGTCWQLRTGRWECECCVCGRYYELPVDTMEVAAGDIFHCGGSPSCCQ